MAINSLQIIIIITAFGIVRSLFVSSIPLEERPSIGMLLPDVSQHPNLPLLPLNTCGLANNDDRIVSGDKTGVFEFPWMALLSYDTLIGPEFGCAGSIINQRYVLTAAHCIKNKICLPLTKVRVGEHDYKSLEDCEINSYDGEKLCAPPFQEVAIEKVIMHPEFDSHSVSNDVALLRLDRNLDLTSSDTVKAVCLPIGNMANVNLTNKGAIITGWGATEKATASSVLLKVEIPIVDNEHCRNLYEHNLPVTEKQICAGGRDRRDSCQGDSGGPLQVVGYLNEDVRFVQQGIASYGPTRCGLRGVPAVYTRVAAYMDWILDNLRS